MIRTIATPELRRAPALTLLPALLLLGALVSGAPVRDAGVDSVSAHVPVLRAPVLRVPPAGSAAVALPETGIDLPVGGVVAERLRAPAHAPAYRAASYTPYLSRAPPASS